MEISFSKEELLRLANIFDNAGQVFLAGLVVAPFFSKIDFGKVFVIALFSIYLCMLVCQLAVNKGGE